MIPPHTKAVIMSLTHCQSSFMTPDNAIEKPNMLLELPVVR